MPIGRPRSCLCGECKKCRQAAYMRAWWQRKTPEERRAYIARRDMVRVRKHDRDRSQTAHRKAAKRAFMQRYNTAFPEKAKARAALADAVRSGRVIRQPCFVCGDPKSQGHHPDYGKPLEVIWLCDLHHKAEHGFLRPDLMAIARGTF